MVDCQKLEVCNENINIPYKAPTPCPGATAVVVVPVYKKQPSEAERLSFKQCIEILGEHPVRLAAPKSLDIAEYEKIAGRTLEAERFTDSFFRGIDGYNELLVSAHFYLRFAAFDYMFIYQLDAWVFSDQLLEWCAKGYDYIGAPWFQGHLSHEQGALPWRSGNGGLSLRRIDKFIEVTETGIPRQKVANGLWEDRVFTMGLDGTEYQMSSPDVLEAARFAVERSPEYFYELTGTLPFGCHAWERFGIISFWRGKIPYEPPKPHGKRLSIITITYNDLKGLKRTADSILSQTWLDFEWIIVDGGSTDGSAEYIREVLAPYVAWWCSEKDAGVYDAQNKGIAHANGEYVNFMNSGDTLFLYTTLAKVFNPFPRADIVYGDWLDIFKDGPAMRTPPKEIPADFFDYDYCNLSHQSLFIRTALLKRKGFDTNYRIYADWVRWRELAHEGATFYKAKAEICSYDAREGLSVTGSEKQAKEYASLGLKQHAIIEKRDYHERLSYKIGDLVCRALKRVHIVPEDVPPSPRKLENPDLDFDYTTETARPAKGSNPAAIIPGARTAIIALDLADGVIYNYNKNLLQAMKATTPNLIVVGNRDLEPEAEEYLRSIACAYRSERHYERMLGSYRFGYELYRELGLDKTGEQLVLMDSTVCGPVYSPEAMFETMEKTSVDFWGETAYDTDGVRYLEPYFLVFSEKAKRLVGDVLASVTELKAITPALARKGLYWDSYVQLDVVEGEPMWRPLTLLERYHVPFVLKRSLCGETHEDIVATVRHIDKVNHELARTVNLRFYKK